MTRKEVDQRWLALREERGVEEGRRRTGGVVVVKQEYRPGASSSPRWTLWKKSTAEVPRDGRMKCLCTRDASKG